MSENMSPYVPNSQPNENEEGALTPYTPPTETPTEEPEYGPEDFERIATIAIRNVVERDNARAKERYGRRFGKVREWFSREGKRSETETLEQIGEWQKNAKWKKWAKFGAKIAGGVGVAGAMISTGGAGAILTPMLWSAGMREAFDGTMEAAEELGWGRKRSQAELDVQAELTQKITALKEGVRSQNIDQAEFQRLIDEMIDAEDRVIAQQETNITGERKGKLVRSIASTVLTIGTGLFAGVPLGAHDYDKVAPAHRVAWNLKNGGQFLYNNSHELVNAAAEAAKHGYGLTVNSIYGQASHILGHGLPLAEKIGLVSSAAYLVGRSVIDSLGARKKRPSPSPTPYMPYGPTEPPIDPEEPPYIPETTTPPYIPESTEPEEPSESPGIEGINESEGISGERSALESYLQGQNEAYRAELETQNQTLPEMSEKCRLAINIPASYAEHRIIYHTLEQYVGQKDKDGQPLPNDTFEINIFVNGPVSKQDEIDQTAAEVERFKNDHPDMKVNVVTKSYEERRTIGEFRKYITDLALLRGLKRPKQNSELYMVFHDADCEGMDPAYLASIADTLDKNPQTDLVSTMEDYPEEDMKKYPLLYAARRLHQFSLQVMTSARYGPENPANPAEAGFPKVLGLWYGFRASSYAEVGGYKPEWEIAEDINLGMEIAKNSKSGKEATKKIGVRYKTSPRRGIAALEKGIPLMQIYSEFGQDEKLREQNKPINLEKMDTNNRGFQKELEKQASGTFLNIFNHFFWPEFNNDERVKALRRENGRSADTRALQEELRKDPNVGGKAYRDAGVVFRRAMGFWGAEYRLEQDQYGHIRVKITDWSKLREGLERAK
jgi:hypothetical protein